MRNAHRTAESVSNASTVPDPIFTIGDTRSLRDAYGEKKFWGHAVRIGRELGRKNVRTDEPTWRVDTNILETLIQLDGTTDLPIRLRVNSFIVQ